jgi:hypothetical protein
MSERFTGSTAQPYAAAWRDYRQRRWAVAAMVIGMVGLTCFGLDPSRETTDGQIFWSIVWAILIILIARWRIWRCPRCEHYFFPVWYRYGRFGRDRCDNCGLPKWSMSDPESDASASGV